MKLYERHWPTSVAKAAIALIHGAGEHGGRYAEFAATMNLAGYAVLNVDLPGHGRSEGRRGHVHTFADYMDAVDYTFAYAERTYVGLPIILFGHSLGGLIAIRYMQSRKVPVNLRSVVLSSPCLELSLPISPTKIRLAKLLNRIWPTLTQPNGIQPGDVSRSADIVTRYASDSLMVHKVSVRWMNELLAAMTAAHASNVPFPVPTLILQAGTDRLVSSEATKKFAERLQSPRTEFHLFPQCYHELINEPERDEVIQRMVDWLDPLVR